MHLLNIDNFIVISYLILTLIIGIIKGRNIKSIKEYAIGNFNFSTAALVATITATWLDAAAAIGAHEKIYQFGIVWIIIFMGGALEIFLFQLLTPRIYKFKGHLSVSEILGTWYSPRARIIGGICVALHSIGIIGAQVAAIGYVCYEFFHISPSIGMLIGAGIVVIYSSLGGIKAVTITDMIQFAFFMVAISVIANVLIMKIGGFRQLINHVPAEHLKLLPSYNNPIEYLILFIFFTIPFFDSCIIQRVLMARDERQAATSLKATAVVMVVFYVLCGLIALSVRGLNADLNPNDVLYYTINNYLPAGIKGLGIAGLLAVIMSSADSYLNTSSVAIIHDVITPLRKTSLSIKEKLFITKVASLIIGSGAILVAISFESIINIIIKAWIVWAAIMVVPLYAVFFNIKANFQIFLSGALAGISTVIIWIIFDIEAKIGIDSNIPALFANLVAFIVSSFYYHKYASYKLYIPLYIEEEVTTNSRGFLNKIRYLESFFMNYYKYLPTINNLARLSRIRVHYYGAQYKLFGSFAIASFLIPYFMWSESSTITIMNQEISVILRFIACVLAFMLVIHDMWEVKLQRYLPLYWHFTLMYCLPFMTTFLFLYNEGSIEWYINMAVALFLLALLVDWQTFIAMITGGVGLGYSLYVCLMAQEKLNLIFSDLHKWHLFLYVAIIPTLVGMLFARNREYIQKRVVEILDYKVQERTDELERALVIKKEFLSNLSHEIRIPVMGIINYSQGLYARWPDLTEEKKLEILQKLDSTVERFYSFVDNIMDMSKFESGTVELNPSQINLEELIQEAIIESKSLPFKQELSISYKNEAETPMIEADRARIKQVLHNLLDNAIKYTNKGMIDISLQEGKEQMEDGSIISGIKVSIADEGMGIPEDELELIFDSFSQSTRTKTGAGGRGLGLSISRRIIEAHCGKIWAQPNKDKGAILSFILTRKL
ncbi:sodium:solute symporter family transporter [Rickettsiales endosymbiont of Stachyamoeba lipophora]|uniref:sodium:solute symporter family transporter n=1 Tax=Rickettsiales endosymbiont of Stachyamoeba lipophora TaxID=2486578 RepID=UPI000F64AEDA|nr:ATP-binding protein [Rickettsiales endosymbiont of Stachyamoeba lipophora]AZL16165.1 hypothetical protein EF513_06435 [Rickettsiales endosymbiont of Stachyamoeba lipophora]